MEGLKKSGADDFFDDSSLLNHSVEPNDSKHVSSQKVLYDQGDQGELI